MCVIRATIEGAPTPASSAGLAVGEVFEYWGVRCTEEWNLVDTALMGTLISQSFPYLETLEQFLRSPLGVWLSRVSSANMLLWYGSFHQELDATHGCHQLVDTAFHQLQSSALEGGELYITHSPNTDPP